MDAALIGPHLVLKSLQNLGKKLGSNGQPIKCGKNRDSAMWQESSQRFLSEEVCGEVELPPSSLSARINKEGRESAKVGSTQWHHLQPGATPTLT